MLSRRSFFLSAVATSAVTTLARGQTAPAPSPSANASTAPQTLLRLERRNIDVNGKAASVYWIAQPDGTQGIRTQAGAQFRVRVENHIAEPSLIHWHGLTPPWQQDGVPGISGPPIPAGGSADYDFPLRFGGTFWMHSHQGLQEQSLMAAPLIIQDDRIKRDQQDVVLMLADFSFTPAEEILAKLKKGGNMPPMGGKGSQMAPNGAAMKPMKMGAAKPDLNDVTYDAFLANDRTLGDPEVVDIAPIARVLLRVVNSSSMSAFHIDLGALEGELLAVDGFAVAPVTGKRFPIAVAQRLDIHLSIPAGPGAYPVLAVLEGENKQTGIVLRVRDAPIARIPDTAAAASPALTLDLERRLRATAPLALRKADRTHTLNLTGNMAGYAWSLNNVVWTPDTPPLPVAKGERVELVFVNQTPMPHPMAPARPPIPGRGNQQSALPRRRARHRAGAAGQSRGGRLRRRQSRALGAALPSALSPRDRDVRDSALRLGQGNGFGRTAPSQEPCAQ
jgi:FtsP/CotA-like multicopper oxidase with cupredoxin domain